MVERDYFRAYSTQWASVLDTVFQCMKPLCVGESLLIVMRNAEQVVPFRVGVHKAERRLQVYDKTVRYRTRVNPMDVEQLIITRVN